MTNQPELNPVVIYKVPAKEQNTQSNNNNNTKESTFDTMDKTCEKEILYSSNNFPEFSDLVNKICENYIPKFKQFVEYLVKQKYSLRNADLRGDDLRGTNLSKANLRNADLLRADLHGVYLSIADLAYANLQKANLVGIYLRNADLSNADLSNATLVKANLENAILKGANLLSAKMPLRNQYKDYDPEYTFYTIYSVLQKDNSYLFTLGCKEKTADEWNHFFSTESKEEYNTIRYSEDWNQIKKEWETFYKHWQEEFVEFAHERL